MVVAALFLGRFARILQLQDASWIEALRGVPRLSSSLGRLNFLR